MKANSNLMIERLKENVNQKSGCSVLFLKVLKSDLNRLLKQYMNLGEIAFDVLETDSGYILNISAEVKEFFEIGLGG